MLHVSLIGLILLAALCYLSYLAGVFLTFRGMLKFIRMLHDGMSPQGQAELKRVFDAYNAAYDGPGMHILPFRERVRRAMIKVTASH